MANAEDTSGSYFRHLRRRVSQLLQSNQLPLGVQLLVGLIVFIAGIAFQRELDIGFEVLFKHQDGAKWIIMLIFALGAIGLLIVVGTLFGHVFLSHRAILEGVESRFAITARYISDDGVHGGGRTYTETQELIERANESLIFVDWWVGSSNYDESRERKDYYKAITERIRNYRDENSVSGRSFTHKRIIQMPKGTSLSVLKKDKVYAEHISECVQLEARVGRGITEVSRASPFTHLHFAIIDRKYLVQPILTTDPGGLKRHGAIIFADLTESRELVSVYEEMIKHLRLHDLDEEDVTSLSVGSQAIQSE